MASTAIGAAGEDARTITFMNKEHKEFYLEYLPKCRWKDVYHKALVYCLGIDRDTRKHVNRIYDFKNGSVKPECLQEGWQTSGSVRVVRMAFNLYCNRYESLDEAMQEYLRLPNHQKKVLGIQNTETMQESMDFIRCENGIDRLTHAYEQIGGWLNPEIYEAVNKMENMLDWNEVQIAYQIGKQYFTIQTAEDGYDYTFYNEDYQEDDGGIYDNPTIYVDEAASDILEDKGYSLEDAKVVDYEDLMADVEEVQEEQMQRIQLEKNCPASIFEGFRREEAMQTYEGIAMQFTRSKGYLTIQATEEGYSFIFYDSDLHEIQGGDYDNPDASIQEAAYEILKSERMDDMECVKVDYKEFEEMTIQHSKDLLQEGELRATSEIGRNELALNSLSRAEVERGVLYHAHRIWQWIMRSG